MRVKDFVGYSPHKNDALEYAGIGMVIREDDHNYLLVSTGHGVCAINLETASRKCPTKHVADIDKLTECEVRSIFAGNFDDLVYVGQAADVIKVG